MIIKRYDQLTLVARWINTSFVIEVYTGKIQVSILSFNPTIYKLWFNKLLSYSTMSQNPCIITALLWFGVNNLGHLCLKHWDAQIKQNIKKSHSVKIKEENLKMLQNCWDPYYINNVKAIFNRKIDVKLFAM